MIALPRRTTLRALAPTAALALAVAACSGEEQEAGPVSTPPASTETQPAPAPPPPPPATEVRVLDGDTDEPIAGARVAGAGEVVETAAAGAAELGPERRRVRVRVSAPGYGARTVRLDFRERLVQRVRLWRPDLQWPMFGVDRSRTQVHDGIKIRPPFRVAWTRGFGSLLEFPAVVWNGLAYASNIDGHVFAVDTRRGKLVWEKRIGTLMASSPGLDPERGVLVTTSMSPGYAHVISMETGRELWRFPSGRAEPSPLVHRGVAYFGAANGNVYALDLERRQARWVYRGGVKITSSPTMVGNRLFFGDYSGRVVALNARTGRVLWRGSAGGRVYGTVAVAGGRVFAPSVFSGMSALSARTGRLLWRVPVGAYLYSSPAVFRGRVYFGTYAGLVYSVSARSGRILWTRPAGGRVSGAVQVVAGVAYAASLENRTTAWHWRTGETLWTFRRGKYVPVSGNGRFLLMHGARRIWAMEPRPRR